MQEALLSGFEHLSTNASKPKAAASPGALDPREKGSLADDLGKLFISGNAADLKVCSEGEIIFFFSNF